MHVAVHLPAQFGCLFGIEMSFPPRIGYGLPCQSHTMGSGENVGNCPPWRSNRHTFVLRQIGAGKLGAVNYNPPWFFTPKSGVFRDCKMHLGRVDFRKPEYQKRCLV
jgi:hypothetical protein